MATKKCLINKILELNRKLRYEKDINYVKQLEIRALENEIKKLEGRLKND